MKTCNGCAEQKVIWKNHEGGKYCQYCWQAIKFKKEGFKPRIQKQIPAKSKKRAELDKIYSQLRKLYFVDHPMCEAALPGKCQGEACDIHHKKGRGKYYLVVDTWMAVCRECHQWIELHPPEATEMGFRESKITD